MRNKTSRLPGQTCGLLTGAERIYDMWANDWLYSTTVGTGYNINSDIK